MFRRLSPNEVRDLSHVYDLCVAWQEYDRINRIFFNGQAERVFVTTGRDDDDGGRFIESVTFEDEQERVMTPDPQSPELRRDLYEVPIVLTHQGTFDGYDAIPHLDRLFALLDSGEDAGDLEPTVMTRYDTYTLDLPIPDRYRNDRQFVIDLRADPVQDAPPVFVRERDDSGLISGNEVVY